MAIGTTAALIGSAVIGAGASALGAGANSRAINAATDAQTQANRESIALQGQIYNKNNALLSPFVERGNAAGDNINALLGVSTPTDYAAYVQKNPDLLADYQRRQGEFSGIADYGQKHFASSGQMEGRKIPSISANGASGAFNNYLDSAGYQFQLGEMNKGADAQFRAAGALDSGAAVKAAQERAQNLSTGFFNNYLGLLGNQQGVGLSGASAVAGVGQNYANNVSGLNQNNANALGNAAMARAGNTNSLLSNLSSSFGMGMGALSGFGKGGGYTPGAGSGGIGSFWG